MRKLKRVIDIIRNRRSIRRFNDRKISRRVIVELIDAARWAPCPNNMQPWKFFIAERNSFTNNMVIQHLAKEGCVKNIAISIFLNDAVKVLRSSFVNIYVFNNRVVTKRYERMVGPYFQKKARIFEHQSIAAAIENLMLCAEESGLGTVWLGSPFLTNNGIEKIFHTEYELSAIVAMGYYDKKPKQTQRHPVNDIMVFAK